MISGINILLIIALCALYKLTFHTFSTLNLNHLCCRFSPTDILVALGIRFFAIFAPYFVATTSRQNQEGSQGVPAMQVLYNLGPLVLCCFKLSKSFLIQRGKSSTSPTTRP